MRILHTADWHLGQHLHGVSRAEEHQRFLDWLRTTLEVESIDALIVAGDVFDVASPSPAAQSQYYRFLAECRAHLPRLDIFVVGGNHDSPVRLDAPSDLLHALDIHVIGGLPLRSDGSTDEDRVIRPIHAKDRSIAGWIIAVPFLRPRDLPSPSGSSETSDIGTRLLAQHRELYASLVERADARRAPKQPILATGHLYMADSVPSMHSERKIQVGHQFALPIDIFPPTLTYVALGHLHRAQTVGHRANVRYAGSPIPLSMAERDYDHQVVIVDLEGEKVASIRSLLVPRTVEMLCVPDTHRPLPEVLDALRTLPRSTQSSTTASRPSETPSAQSSTTGTPLTGKPSAKTAPTSTRPLLEVRVALEKAEPRLRQEIEQALTGADVRLVRIDVRHPNRGAEALIPPPPDLASSTPEDVFRACHRRARGREPPERLIDLFAELVAAASGDDAESKDKTRSDLGVRVDPSVRGVDE